MNFNFEKYNVPFDHYIVDNFLPEEDFKLAQLLIMDYGFPV